NIRQHEADNSTTQNLHKAHTNSDQANDQRAQAYRNAVASVAANEAMVKQAQLDLEFTELRAPVAARIGDRRVSQGNLVTGGTGGPPLPPPPGSLDPPPAQFTLREAPPIS